MKVPKRAKKQKNKRETIKRELSSKKNYKKRIAIIKMVFKIKKVAFWFDVVS